MKNFALAVVAIAFGAVMLAGCPGANNTTNTGGDKAKDGCETKKDGEAKDGCETKKDGE